MSYQWGYVGVSNHKCVMTNMFHSVFLLANTGQVLLRSIQEENSNANQRQSKLQPHAHVHGEGGEKRGNLSFTDLFNGRCQDIYIKVLAEICRCFASCVFLHRKWWLENDITSDILEKGEQLLQ